MKEASPGPQPPLGTAEDVSLMETDNQDPGKEQKKAKKRIKTAAKKKTPEEEPFNPLVPETRITISALEEAALFSIQSTEEKFHADLDRDLTEIKAEARNVVPMVRKNNHYQDEQEKQGDTDTNPNIMYCRSQR